MQRILGRFNVEKSYLSINLTTLNTPKLYKLNVSFEIKFSSMKPQNQKNIYEIFSITFNFSAYSSL